LNLRKLFYSVRYTKRSQLIARLRLLVKRKIIERFPDFFNRIFAKPKVLFKLSEKLPKPVLQKREGAFREKDKSSKQFELTFLNESRSYQLPVNWHEEELEYGTRLWKLNLHYMEFLEEVDNDWFRKIIKDWIKQNPPYKKGYWLDSWNSFALSIRVVVWMQQLARRNRQLSSEFVKESSESIYRQLLFLEKNIENDIKGNHLIKNIKALVWGSSFFKSDKNVERWSKLGIELLNNELDEQILGDGMHYERSPAYHCQVLADLMECFVVLPEGSFKEKLRSILLDMGNALSKVTHPDGKISLFNDGGLDMAYSPDELVDVLENHVGFSVQKREEIVLDKAGYYGVIKGDNYLLFDAGQIAPDFLPAHGHGDIFSFELSMGDHRIFIDKGVYEYNTGEKRRLSRSTQSHNTVTIAGQDQCEFWHSFRVARRANVEVLDYEYLDKSFRIKARHDGYTRLNGNPVHQRQIEFDGDKLKIEDEIIGGQGQKAEARFLLHPKVTIEEDSTGLLLKIRKDPLLKVSTKNPTKVIKSTWFPNFGVEEKTKQITIDLGSVPVTSLIEIEISD